MYRVYYGPHLKGVWPTPVEVINHVKFLRRTRGRGLSISVVTPYGFFER